MNKVGKPKEPWFAVNLSNVFPGVGQIYASRITRGCIFISAQVALVCFGYWLLCNPAGNIGVGFVFLLLSTVVAVLSLIDAYRCARKRNTEDFEKSRRRDKDPWLAVFLSQLLPGLGHFYLRKWIWGLLFIAGLLVIAVAQMKWFPLLVLTAAWLTLVCYHAYSVTPIKREASRKLILILAVCIFANGLMRFHFPIYIKKNMFQAFKIASTAMSPTLERGDRILVTKSRKYIPQRGDIIVFSQEDKRTYIFRLVAFSGESVEINNGSVIVNGSKLEDAPLRQNRYVSCGKFGAEGSPFVVPEGCLFVLGDNSINSRDSRYIGPIPEKSVIGKASKVYWPIRRAGAIE